ncbi:MAG: hypothetical protein HN380_30410, partial [Victivallales bacterium]|nr:hypothetical protein [Victivallales bacterium]
MTFRRRLPVLALAVLSVPAAALEPCEIMRPEHLQAYLNQIDSNFDRFDTAKAEEHLGELRRRLPCLTTVIDQQDLVRLARQQAALAFFSQDIWEMARWGHAADTVLPEHPWPDGFGEDHPMRQQLVLLETVAIVGPEERFLAPPRGGGIFWNGVLLTEPKAPLETPGLVQMAGHTGEVVFSYWQDGGAFREEVLAPAGSRAKTIKPPSWWGPKDTPKTPKASSMLVSLSLVGGFGSTGQKPDSPGNFLPEVGEANGMLGFSTVGLVPIVNPVGAFWQAALPIQFGSGFGADVYAGGALFFGSTRLEFGGGGTTVQLSEGGSKRTIVLPQPHLGAEAIIPISALSLDI